MKAVPFLLRLFGIFSLIAGVAIVYDLFVGSPEHDFAIVTGKTHTSGRYGSSDVIYAQGRFKYDEAVSSGFYKTCANGDTLELILTPIFKEWRHIVLVRHGMVIEQAVGMDIWYMALFGLLFLMVAGSSFFAPSSISRQRGFLILISPMNVIALVLCLKYLGVLAGIFEKM